MPINEKEYNGNLFDQLTLLERLEIAAKKDNATNVLEQIAFEKRAIERKLYQQPPLIEGKWWKIPVSEAKKRANKKWTDAN